MAEHTITGIHHVTAIAGDPQRNLDFYTEARPGYLTYKMAKEYAGVIASSGVRTLRLFDPMLAFEESSRRYPLYNPLDYHTSPQGNIWIGKVIFDYLRRWRPWKL